MEPVFHWRYGQELFCSQPLDLLQIVALLCSQSSDFVEECLHHFSLSLSLGICRDTPPNPASRTELSMGLHGKLPHFHHTLSMGLHGGCQTSPLASHGTPWKRPRFHHTLCPRPVLRDGSPHQTSLIRTDTTLPFTTYRTDQNCAGLKRAEDIMRHVEMWSAVKQKGTVYASWKLCTGLISRVKHHKQRIMLAFPLFAKKMFSFCFKFFVEKERFLRFLLRLPFFSSSLFLLSSFEYSCLPPLVFVFLFALF